MGVQYAALMADYDGTLASDGRVHPATRMAVARARTAGLRFVLVTGRELEDLLEVFPDAPGLCDRIVAETGALLYRPITREVRMLAHSASPRLVAALRMRAVRPLSVGRAIVSTSSANERVVRGVIRELGVTASVSRNLGALMVLPRGVDKGSGTRAPLRELALTAADAVGVGDAENDEPLLRACGLSVAVAYAIDRVKRRAELVTDEAEGAGVVELCDRILADDLPLGRRGQKPATGA
jgi:hydroxymethylpyrimidine pyrophosphatase-like HAD family hydrolase